jgi:hypothetical protein
MKRHPTAEPTSSTGALGVEATFEQTHHAESGIGQAAEGVPVPTA